MLPTVVIANMMPGGPAARFIGLLKKKHIVIFYFYLLGEDN